MKIIQNHLCITMIIIMSLATQSTKCPDANYELAPSHEVELTEVKTSSNPKTTVIHNQNATITINKFLPDTAKQPINNKPATHDSMGGGLDLNEPHKALSDNNYKTIKKTGFIDTSNDSLATYNKKDDAYEITSSNRKTTVFNADNKAVKVQKILNDNTKITTNLDPASGQKSSTIITHPVKSGWFSTTSKSTVIQHHDDGTHTATTTTTTSSLFGSKTSTEVAKLDQNENQKNIAPIIKTSRNWNGSTTTTTQHVDGSTSTEIKNLFGSLISKSGTDSNGQPINRYDAQGIEE